MAMLLRYAKLRIEKRRTGASVPISGGAGCDWQRIDRARALVKPNSPGRCDHPTGCETAYWPLGADEYQHSASLADAGLFTGLHWKRGSALHCRRIRLVVAVVRPIG
jgi:hypothetical protein